MNLGRYSRVAAISTAIASVALTSQAFAQEKKAPAAQAQQAAPADNGAVPAGTPQAAQQPNWMKICNTDPQAKKEVCLTSRDVKADTGQTVASIAIRQVSGESKRFFLAAVPPGLLIQPGVRVAVDQNQPVTGKYSICFPNACYAEVEVTDAFFANVKKGNNLVVQAMNQQAKTVNFPISLSGFSKAYDGPALDPKVVQQERERLNAEMTKRAEEARDRLQSQGGAAPSATPAPAGQAPAKQP